jgi:dihydroorotate dehydrogenase electron transfer subunit
MVNAAPGDYFGLTGPLGNSFQIDKYEKFLVLGGGIGIAPVLYLAGYIASKNKKNISLDLIIGERNADNIIYKNELDNLNLNNFSSVIYTDDGSMGKKGFPSNDLDEILKKKKYDSVCICGPEIMMVKSIDIIKKYVPEAGIQVCMERYMKCGIGLCGSCVIDDIGERVCTEGPVFSYSNLGKSREFGSYHRDSYGIITK